MKQSLINVLVHSTHERESLWKTVIQCKTALSRWNDIDAQLRDRKRQNCGSHGRNGYKQHLTI